MQSSVATDVSASKNGALADSRPSTVESHVATESIPFGRFVCRITASPDESCSLPAVTGDVTSGRAIGFSVYDASKEDNAADGYLDNEPVSVLRKGLIWVDCETAAAVGGAVFVRFQDAGALGLGAVRNDADTADAVALPGAYFRSVLSGAGIVQIEVNLPQ